MKVYSPSYVGEKSHIGRRSSLPLWLFKHIGLKTKQNKIKTESTTKHLLIYKHMKIFYTVNILNFFKKESNQEVKIILYFIWNFSKNCSPFWKITSLTGTPLVVLDGQ